MAQLPGISAGDFITKCSHLLTAATGNSSPQILTLLNAALEGQICPWHSVGGSHPLSSYSGILSGEGAMCLRSRKGRGKPKRTSVVRCVRGSDSDNRLPESPVWCDVGGCSRGRVPRPAPGWLPRPCHGNGRPQAGSGAPSPAGTLLKLRETWGDSDHWEILPLRLQPSAQRVSAARHLPASHRGILHLRGSDGRKAAGRRTRGRRRFPVLGAWPSCGWATSESGTRPSQPRLGMRDAGRGCHPSTSGQAQL